MDHAQETDLLAGEVFDHQTFSRLTLTENVLKKKSFTDCVFEHCHLFEVRFEACRFERCSFLHCDLSMSKVDGCIWLGVAFEQCKLMGVNWARIKELFPPKVRFSECVLTYGSFMELDLKEVSFCKCKATEVNFCESDLSGVIFEHTDLAGSDFLHTNLSQADFRSAKNYKLNLNDNRVEGAKFAFPEAISLLKSFGVEVDFQMDEKVGGTPLFSKE